MCARARRGVGFKRRQFFSHHRRMLCLFWAGRGGMSTHPNAADEVMVRLLCFLSLSKSMAAQA